MHSIPLIEISRVTAPDAESMIPSLSSPALPLISEKMNDSAIMIPNTYDMILSFFRLEHTNH